MAAKARPSSSDRGDLSKLLLSLSLNPVSPPPITIAATDFSAETEECLQSVVGRFCSTQEVNLRHFHPALSKAWKNAAFKVSKLCFNTYQFFFSSRSERDWVLANGPWSCDDILLAMQPWRRELGLSDAVDWTVPFWVHLRGIPRECVSMKVGLRLTEVFPGWEVCQIREFQDTSERFFRIRAQISINSPLPRGFPLLLPHYGNCVVTIQYERLPHLCFKCGLIFHTINACPLSPGEITKKQEETLPYGPFMHALYTRGSLLSSCSPLDVCREDLKTPPTYNPQETPGSQDPSGSSSSSPVQHMQIVPFQPLFPSPLSRAPSPAPPSPKSPFPSDLNPPSSSTASPHTYHRPARKKTPRRKPQNHQTPLQSLTPTKRQTTDSHPHPDLTDVKKGRLDGLFEVPLILAVAESQPRQVL